MERLTPASLNRSALVAWLARRGLVDARAAPPSLATGMGRWLGWADAIALAAALQAAPGAGPARTPGAGPARAPGARGLASAAGAEGAEGAEGSEGAEGAFARVSAALDRAIDDDGASADAWPGLARAADDPAPAETAFAPFRRRYVALQQAMASGIGPLRAQARAELARQSPELSRLAAIDAVMDDVLGAREQALLAQLPSLLQKHCERRLGDQGEAAAAARAGPAAASQPANWHPEMRADLRCMLRAELALRLLPVRGLIEALRAGRRRTDE